MSEGHFKAALSKLRTENESLVRLINLFRGAVTEFGHQVSAAAASRAPDPKIADLVSILSLWYFCKLHSL